MTDTELLAVPRRAYRKLTLPLLLRLGELLRKQATATPLDQLSRRELGLLRKHLAVAEAVLLLKELQALPRAADARPDIIIELPKVEGVVNARGGSFPFLP
jgi:hypothetical protein